MDITQENKTDFDQLSAELKRMQADMEKMQRENALLKAILNRVPVGVFVKDPSDEFRYVYCNQSFTDTQGEGKSVVGKHDFDIFCDKDDAVRLRKHDKEVMETGRPHDYEESYRDAKGNINLLMSMKEPFQAPGCQQELLLGTTLEFSKIPQVDKTLMEAYNRAETSSKMKSVFLSNMSHEIRTPLNAIVGFTELLNNPDITMSQREREDLVRQVQSNIALMVSIFNDILDISRLENGTVQFNISEFDLSEMMEGIYCLYAKKLEGKDVKLIYEQRENSVVMRKDLNKFMQMLYNYLNNAIKYTEHGNISFGYVLQPENKVKLYVRDTGIGIPKDKQEIIFNRFEKIGSKVHGSGLGLAIVKGLAEAMGGSCGVDSEPGKGSCFWIVLPCE